MLSSPAGFAQFAWLLFVQAARPAGSLLMFETWAEQCQLNPLLLGCPPPTVAAAERRLGHASALLAANRRKAGNAPNLEITQAGLECNNADVQGIAQRLSGTVQRRPQRAHSANRCSSMLRSRASSCRTD